jgi:hypothetical protein
MRKQKIILLVFIATVAILLVISACHVEPAPSLPPTTPTRSSTASITPSKTIT